MTHPPISPPRPFNFDTVFDDAGFVVTAAPPRPKRSFTPDEVEAIREEAYQKGEASAVVVAQQAQAQALDEIAQTAKGALDVLARVAHEHRSASADLALACGRAIADAALDQFPTAPLQAALNALFGEIEIAPRLVIRTAVADDEIAARIESLARDAGYPGQVVIKAEPGRARAAFLFEWGDGRAAFDPAAAAVRVGEAIAEALAAEGLHAEPLIPDGGS
jgi:flagellar assembly protein FliH